MHHRILIAAVGALCALSPPASAQLTGSTLTAAWWYPTQGVEIESHDVVVDHQVEIPSTLLINDFKYGIDIGADYIEFQFELPGNWTNANFNGWAFADTLGVLPPFRGYSVESSAGVTGLSAIVTGFTDDQVWVDFGGVSTTAGSFIRFAIDVEPIGIPYCMTNPNSTGVAGALSASGSPFVASNLFALDATGLPADATTLFLVSPLQGFVTNPGGSSGNLCLGGALGRYLGQGEVQSSDAGGAASLSIDLTQVPSASGPITVAVGETWHFQAWHRDVLPSGATTSNFTNGLSVTFE